MVSVGERITCVRECDGNHLLEVRMMSAAHDFTVGDIVRFKEVVDPGDDKVRFVVVEDNGDRLFGKLVCNLPIPPVQLLRRKDVCKA